MSFFRSIFGGSEYTDPMAAMLDEMDADFERRHPETAARLEAQKVRRAKAKATTEAKIAVATTWWETELTKLADEHAKAVNKITQHAQSVTTGRLKQSVDDAGKKLKIAQGILLQQSDVRWGTDVTDSALEALDYESVCFRIHAG